MQYPKLSLFSYVVILVTYVPSLYNNQHEQSSDGELITHLSHQLDVEINIQCTVEIMKGSSLTA